MKKTLRVILSLLLVLSFVLASCDGGAKENESTKDTVASKEQSSTQSTQTNEETRDETTEDSSEDVSDDDEIKAKYVRYIPEEHMPSHDTNEFPHPKLVIRSTEELRAYLGDRSELRDSGDAFYEGDYIDFNAYEVYDSKYFENNILVLLLLEEGSGSISHKIDSVTKTEEGLDVVIEYVCPEVLTADMAYWTLFIELDKEYDVLPDNINVSGISTSSWTYISKARLKYTPGETKDLPKVQVIYNPEEYNTYIQNSGYDFDADFEEPEDYYSLVNKSYLTTLDTYDDDFFKENVLVMIAINAPNHHTRYRVNGLYNVKKDVPSIDLTVESFDVTWGDETPACWHIYYAIEKLHFKEELLNVHFTEYEAFHGEIEFDEQIIRTMWNDTALSPKIFSNTYHPKQFYNQYAEVFDFESNNGYTDMPTFKEVWQQFDHAFFYEKKLLLIPISSGSGSISYRVKSLAVSLENGQQKLEVTVEEDIPSACTDDMAQWFIFVAFDNDYRVGDRVDMKMVSA